MKQRIERRGGGGLFLPQREGTLHQPNKNGRVVKSSFCIDMLLLQ